MREVARRVGVSHTTIVKLANGQARPSISLCRELARVFGVPYQDLLRMSGVLPEVSAKDSDDRAVSYLLERLMGMEQVQRQESVVLMNAILDYRQAAGAQTPAPRNGGRRRRTQEPIPTDDPGELRKQFRALWDALPQEDREEIYQEIQLLLAAGSGPSPAAEPSSDQ